MPIGRGIKRGEDKIDINISPMIDMVFILLIFFIVTTVFVEEVGIDATRPEPSTEQQKDDDIDPVIFIVTKTGKVRFENSDIGLNNVRSTVQRRLNEVTDKEKLPIIVQVEEAAPAGLMVQVVDEARLGGGTFLPKVSLDKAPEAN